MERATYMSRLERRRIRTTRTVRQTYVQKKFSTSFLTLEYQSQAFEKNKDAIKATLCI